MKSTYQKELVFAKKLALEAGKIITRNFLHSKITTKSNLTPVTEIDIAVSKMVIKAVAQHFPNHKVLDEELQHEAKDAEYVWVCDPIDGTIPFSHHTPTSMFSLALCRNGEPVVAVIYDPFMKRLLYTQEDDLTYMNGKKIQVKKGPFEKGDFVYGISYWNRRFDSNKYIDILFKKNLRVTYIESIVYQLMLIATGVSRGLVIIAANPWDRAAGKMIVENAGGKCTDETGKRLPVFGNPKYLIASNGDVHSELLEILKASTDKKKNI